MQREAERVLELQPEWTKGRTPAMDERGQLVRDAIPAWMRAHRDELCVALGIPDSDLLIEGSDGTGLKAKVPWVRLASRTHSHRATEGFYVVYLWSFDGTALYLSLNQGTTTFENGGNVRRPRMVIDGHVRRARQVLSGWERKRWMANAMSLGDPNRGSLGAGYELGNIACVAYQPGHVPDDGQLLSELLEFGRALGDLYRSLPSGVGSIESPEVRLAETAAAEAAGKRPPSRGAGFRESAAERQAIEAHAMDLAETYYVRLGWRVERRGAPFDLMLRRDGERKTVEVKGTTSAGVSVVLTEGEVVHHRTAHPHNALVIVRGIKLDTSSAPPQAYGGVLFELPEWEIAQNALKPISYTYAVPSEIWTSGPGTSADTLLG